MTSWISPNTKTTTRRVISEFPGLVVVSLVLGVHGRLALRCRRLPCDNGLVDLFGGHDVSLCFVSIRGSGAMRHP